MPEEQTLEPPLVSVTPRFWQSPLPVERKGEGKKERVPSSSSLGQRLRRRCVNDPEWRSADDTVRAGAVVPAAETGFRRCRYSSSWLRQGDAGAKCVPLVCPPFRAFAWTPGPFDCCARHLSRDDGFACPRRSANVRTGVSRRAPSTASAQVRIDRQKEAPVC
ncbi:hypothetical protein MRX96_033640 [Rhipicephalus microplus]